MNARILREWADQFEAAVNARFESPPVVRSPYFAVMGPLRAGRKRLVEYDAGTESDGLARGYQLFKDAQAEFDHGAGRNAQPFRRLA